MNLGTAPFVVAGDTYLNSPSAPGRLGSVAFGRDGRRFRLVKNGSTALAPGVLVQCVGSTTVYMNLTVATTPVGAKALAVTFPSGSGTFANTYAGGMAIVSSGAGAGQSFLVKGHDAIPAAGGVITVQLESDEAVMTALATATSKIDMIISRYLVVISPGTAAANNIVGVTVAPIDANNYGYVQDQGVAAVLIDGAIAIGQAVSPSVTVPGAVVINSTTLPVIGSSVTTLVAGRTMAVQLQL